MHALSSILVANARKPYHGWGREQRQGERNMGITSQPGFEGERVRREVERERHERIQHDELRIGVAAADEFRTKDARESTNSTNLKRPHGR
jgi:hypothetical protein